MHKHPHIKIYQQGEHKFHNNKELYKIKQFSMHFPITQVPHKQKRMYFWTLFYAHRVSVKSAFIRDQH